MLIGRTWAFAIRLEYRKEAYDAFLFCFFIFSDMPLSRKFTESKIGNSCFYSILNMQAYKMGATPGEDDK